MTTGLPTPPAPPPGLANGHITEDEASLYDRQIRLWGLEAQNRMRSSTVLILSLRSVAHEIIKNLVLAGIGRLIVMDDGPVTEEDLGSGFLFREEDNAVGQERTTAAVAQIQSLNPLVSLTALPTLSPFVRNKIDGAVVDGHGEGEIVDFLKRENVDVVVGCDLTRGDLERLDIAARKAGTMVYGTGTYGFYGYAYANLGEKYQFVHTANDKSKSIQKKILSYPTFTQAFNQSNWLLPKEESGRGGSPYRGLAARGTRDACPQVTVGVLAMWEYEKRHRSLPDGSDAQTEQLQSIADTIWEDLGINKKGIQGMDKEVVQHMSRHNPHFFPPTLAILGGLVAQDVLRVLSRKDTPIANLLVVDSMKGSGNVGSWGMGGMRDDF